MLTDITECGCAQKRIAQCVQGDIAIGMSSQPLRVGDSHTAQHDMISLGESMHIKPLAHPVIHAIIPSWTGAAV